MSIGNVRKIVISRTDSIGDVVLTLPLAGILKEQFPHCTLVFLGSTYTKPVIACCQHIDAIWEWNVLSQMSPSEQIHWLKEQQVDVVLHVFPQKTIARLAKRAGIPHRIGTSHRAFHWANCNHRIHFTRKYSQKHEAQLNVELLSPLGISTDYTLDELFDKVGFARLPELPKALKARLSTERQNVILHPKSQGSAMEWGIQQYMSLAQSLADHCEVFITGTEREAALFRQHVPQRPHIHDLSGKMTLHQLIAFISMADVLVAASTGPLHIAGVCSIYTLGLYRDQRPVHPKRWRPLGRKVVILSDRTPSDRGGEGTALDLTIALEVVREAVFRLLKKGEPPAN